MFDIITIHDKYVAINKHPEVEFHGSGLVDSVREAVGGEIYPVHRIDKVTSGILLFARSKEVAHEICDQFDNREISKTYLAISDKKPKKKQGIVKGDIEKARRGAWKLGRTTNNPSITQFKTTSIREGRRLFLLMPKTGKTHQLRVVMKSLGSPILGDTLYSGTESDRTYLHAYRIGFQIGEESFEEVAPAMSGSEFDAEFSKALQVLLS
jgi:tRNA pseudouridine32 synthase/23S rRNA pseudouridine746 synthase